MRVETFGYLMVVLHKEHLERNKLFVRLRSLKILWGFPVRDQQCHHLCFDLSLIYVNIVWELRSTLSIIVSDSVNKSFVIFGSSFCTILKECLEVRYDIRFVCVLGITLSVYIIMIPRILSWFFQESIKPSQVHIPNLSHTILSGNVCRHNYFWALILYYVKTQQIWIQVFSYTISLIHIVLIYLSSTIN